MAEFELQPARRAFRPVRGAVFIDVDALHEGLIVSEAINIAPLAG